ncbi:MULTISPECIES: tyrosine-type recombinase/integrase [Aquimarina]|uniref:Tyrosine-type recombinase/integrase n=1 Tax=Aquimarina algiphila TaxID=2047982 RepID=A0A554VID4_9FLAO|nr:MULTISPECIES: tyrosine-type recombinase/integrase [Aquimarina]TSE07401.1 tyrosine-type recombinase/integrase [Aquimarina algiphila]
MASIHAILRTRPNKQGLYPLAIRVTQERKSTIIQLGQFIDKKHWDDKKQIIRKSHPNSVRMNNLISSKISEINNSILEAIHTFGDYFTIDDFKSLRLKTSANNSFFTFSDKYFNDLEAAKKFSRLDSEVPLVKKIKEMRAGRDLLFNQITVPYIKHLIVQLKKEGKIGERSIANVLMFIRKIYNLAITENLANRESYPFGDSDGKIRIKIPESIKIGLNREEVTKLEEADFGKKQHLNHARNIWLFSFYLAGMRVADVIKAKWRDFNDGRYYYRMSKNQQIVSLKISEQLDHIISQYRPDSGEHSIYIFPELEGVDPKNEEEIFNRTKRATDKFNKNLKKIAKELKITKKMSMHIARHTFGNIASDKIAPRKLQKLYRHQHLSTTTNYQGNFIHQDVDDALDAVINS